MNNISEIKCFIASPNDTTKERNVCEEVFEEINNGIGKVYGFRLSSLRWEKDIYPGIGEYGQDVINNQIDGNYDLFIGIMKTRFGTPTPNAGSGTEEEFDIAYTKYQDGEINHIFFYFGNPTVSFDSIDYLQLSKVKEFRKKVEDCGVLHMSFTDLDSFKERLKRDLENYFIQNQSIQKQKGKSTIPIIAKAKSFAYDYRKLWEEVRELILHKSTHELPNF